MDAADEDSSALRGSAGAAVSLTAASSTVEALIEHIKESSVFKTKKSANGAIVIDHSGLLNKEIKAAAYAPFLECFEKDDKPFVRCLVAIKTGRCVCCT